MAERDEDGALDLDGEVATQAERYGLPTDELKKVVQHELTKLVAKSIAKEIYDERKYTETGVAL